MDDTGLQSTVNAVTTIAHTIMDTESNAMVGTMPGVPANATIGTSTNADACTPTSATVGAPANAMVGTTSDTPMIKGIGAQTNAITDTLQSLLQNSEIIEQGVSTFLEVVSPLISALDQVANIHPFIKGASRFCHAALIMKYPV
jgi:hypothetical protein